jgi:hypothetical protein
LSAKGRKPKTGVSLMGEKSACVVESLDQRPGGGGGGGGGRKPKKTKNDYTGTIVKRFFFFFIGRHTSLMGGTRKKNTPEIM